MNSKEIKDNTGEFDDNHDDHVVQWTKILSDEHQNNSMQIVEYIRVPKELSI